MPPTIQSRSRGAQGARAPPTIQSLRQSALLAALLENLENAKIGRKIHLSGDFRRSIYQNFPGVHAPVPSS